MREELQKLIDENFAVLAQQIDIDSGLRNRLLSRGIITRIHADEIRGERTTLKQNERLLEILKKRDDKYYEMFREEVSREQRELAERHIPLPDDILPNPVPETTP